MARRGIIRRVKNIVADNTDNGVRIKVRVEIDANAGALTTGETDRMIEKLTDDAMLAIARVPYGNVPLSQIKIS